MTTTATPTWQELFNEQRHARLGSLAGRQIEVRSLADEEILLLGAASDAARLSGRPRATPNTSPKMVVLTPESKDSTAEDFARLVSQTRELHPEAELAGFGPANLGAEDRFQGLDRGVVLVGRLAATFEASPDLEQIAKTATPVTAVLVYSPDVTDRALEQAATALQAVPNLVGVVPLPAGAGDRIPLPGLTTAGSTDLMVISVLRLLLPKTVRVRVSWAALGWKVAQVGLAYGADEIAGWTAAESLAYTGRVRAASRVERQELNEGLEEARCQDLGWARQGELR